MKLVYLCTFTDKKSDISSKVPDLSIVGRLLLPCPSAGIGEIVVLCIRAG